LTLLALAVMWRRRPHSVLDLWLMVVMCAWLFDIALAAVLNHGRFDLGFYAGRLYGLLAASFVLAVLLLENGLLYARLAEAHEGERRERRRAEQRTAELVGRTRSWRPSPTRCRTTSGRRSAPWTASPRCWTRTTASGWIRRGGGSSAWCAGAASGWGS
jgi:hypothetical protein